MKQQKGLFEVEGKTVELSNLDKVLYPAVGFTKAQVIDYYIRISPVLLPHLKDRPITMVRFPDGVDQEHFYEKEAPKHTPAWVKRAAVYSRSKKAPIHFILINDLPSLIWSANLANLELHTFLGRAPKVEVPDMVVFDLDPGPPANVIECAQVALWLKEILDQFNLKSAVKVSGSKGMQMYVPVNVQSSYPETRAFAKGLAEYLEQQHPETVVSDMSKQLRTGKVFIDWSQNAEHKTTINVYSLRAKHEKPYVSAPVKWEELENALKKADPMRLYFSPDQALIRMEKFGDLFEPLLKLKQEIPEDLVAKLQPKSKEKTSLTAYRAKRDFNKTKEPAPSLMEPKTGSEPMFVIQKHEASRLHYDFRLEMQGVLRSWAVPKGIPASKGDSRLAMHVEDHPMEYAKFEGTIPEGNYGAGTVMVWDIGTYTVKEANPVHAYFAGKIPLILKGTKLNSEWILIKATRDNEDGRRWLLLKTGPDIPAISKKADDQSVLTGRTMKQIEKDNDAQWISGRKAHEKPRSRFKLQPILTPELRKLLETLPKADPKFVEPMQSKPVTDLPEGNEWIYEVKFDGYRALAIKNGSEIHLISRNEKSLARKYPEIVEAVKELPLETVALDGEVVAIDEKGIPSFQLLQNLPSKGERPVYFYAFDLLNCDGRDTRKLPLIERKKLLEMCLAEFQGVILYSASLEADPKVLVQEISKRGLEGVIAKRRDSLYEPNKRSGAWVKFKTDREQEFVIGGYRPSGKNSDFDSLLVGYFETREFLYASKVRAGFTPAVRKILGSKFKKLVVARCPFINLPEKKEGRWGEGLTAEAMKNFVWLKPHVVCQVRFVEWTQDGHLRHPKFVALREDKKPRQVVRENGKERLGIYHDGTKNTK